jgi:hypothetical protein
MKSLLFIIGMTLSCLAWAGGPDIPWPSHNNSDDDGKKDSDGNWTTPKLQHVYSVYIAKNQAPSADECPYYIVFTEIDPATGEVISEHESLHCNSSFKQASYLQ